MPYQVDPTSGVASVLAALLADDMPMPEAGSPRPGSADKAPRADHQHPRLTATAAGTLRADGTQTIAFTRTFALHPAVTVLAVEAGTGPVPRFKVTGWVQDAGGLYTGCTIYGDRARALPTLSPVAGLLAAVITGVNALTTALTGFLSYEPASSAGFLLIALQPSS